MPKNLLFILSDQHLATALGCRGHGLVRTPNLDRLARSGTLFTRAYCNSPICGPSRLSMMTGTYVHDLGTWCNNVPWNGKAATWAGELTAAGVETASVGKMDVAGLCSVVGFSQFDELYPRMPIKPWPMDHPREQHLPDFRFDGYMDWPHAGTSRETMLAREHLPADRLYTRSENDAYLTGHYDHDRVVTDRATCFLRSPQRRERSWALHVGLLLPHWPYICPQTYLDLYPPDSLPLPRDWRSSNPDLHPLLRHYQRTHNDYRAIRDEAHLRRVLSAYYGMITAMDESVGELLDELDRTGQRDNTLIIYAADHGESGGVHGLWDKLTPYEESCAVPMIFSGPGIPSGRTCDAAVSLVDLFPTVLEWFGVAGSSVRSEPLPGRSLLALCASPSARDSAPDPDANPERPAVFAEYHGIFFPRSWMMLVTSSWKYVWYEDHCPSLFNLAADPGEMDDRAADPAEAERLATFDAALRRLVNPEAVCARVKRDFCLSNQ